MAVNTVLLSIKKPSLRSSQQQVLESAGYEVTATETGQAALDWIQGNPPPKAMVFDSSLPELNTIVLVQNLKQNEAWKSIPIIILLDEKANEQPFIDLGVLDLVSKPCDVTDVRKKIDDYVKYGDAGPGRKKGNKFLQIALIITLGGIAVIFVLVIVAAIRAGK